jgi:hypothetical protein
MTRTVTLRQALPGAAYFGNQLAGESWANWRAVLLAMAGEELTPDKHSAICGLIGPETLGSRGRRSGKSRAMARYATWKAACHDYRDTLAPGRTRPAYGLESHEGPPFRVRARRRGKNFKQRVA